MIVPLVARGHTLGAMTIAITESHRHYSEDDLMIARELAHRGALAVDNARLYREMQDLNRLKDEFLGTVSHELRTPLNAVLGWARLLRGRSLTPGQTQRALDTIERNAIAQAQLIDDLLDVSRIISGKLPLDFQPVELSTVIEAAVDALRPAADAKQVTLVVVLEPGAGSVWGDGPRLQQVIWNLVSNAVKFTPPGGRVEVSLVADGGAAQLRVADSGVGISSDFLPFVFDRFRQADSTTTRRHGGLGLGLAIVRHLVELHGGTVEAHSEGPGLGATFTVRLPIRAFIEQASSGSAEPESLLPVGALLRGVRVLVVDDDRDSRDLAATLLESCGATAIVAGSTAEALTKLAVTVPDVLVADIGMPEEDGYSLIQTIRRRNQGRTPFPAIALTAYAGAENRERALDSGFHMHLPKPFEPSELITAVTILTGRQQV
jgi:signal transduction histidine kinase